MANEIKMPQLSDTMSSGKILEWKKKEGDTVQRGEILAEVETDKANLEIECFTPGTLLKIVVPAGSVAQVGEAIALIGQAGESVSAASPKAQTVSAAPPAQTAKSNEKVIPITQPTLHPHSAVMAASPMHSDSSRIKASPLAKKIAEQKNVDLSGIQGSGPNGRIVAKDVELASGGSVQPQASLSAGYTQTALVEPSPSILASGGTLAPFTKMRETIARRMQESVTQSPHFYVTTSVNMREASKLREILKEDPAYKGISYNHLIIKAVAYGISKERRINRAVKDNQMFEPAHINIGIITAVDDGLLIPVLKNADQMRLKDVVFEAKAAIERARAGRPSASDLQGGTFSISNLGMFDVESFTAIINPGQGGVLAVSSIKEEPIVENGSIVPGLLMRATVSVDHRVIDGVIAGNFLKHFKQALETPALLAL